MKNSEKSSGWELVVQRTNNLSIRLLKDGFTPAKAVKEGIKFEDFLPIPGARINQGILSDAAPKWVNFLQLSSDGSDSLHQRIPYAILFVLAQARWFCVSFGFGHAKLDMEAFEQDFGLKVVMNAVDPNQLRSADLRTPTENTLSLRAQTSRKSDQSAFGIDVEKDIVRGLMGQPKDSAFGTVVSGSDSLSLRRKCNIQDLPSICEKAISLYSKDTYKEHFGWVDQVKHVRTQSVIDALNDLLVKTMQGALNGNVGEDLHLAYPSLYDPDKSESIKFRGFGRTQIYDDPDIHEYMKELLCHKITTYESNFLSHHKVEQCDDHGSPKGDTWKIFDCIVFETEYNLTKYVLSGGRWYEIDKKLAVEVEKFFSSIKQITMPSANSNENEEKYNKRLATSEKTMACMDRRLIKPTGAAKPIEVCDFISEGLQLIHIKDKNSSSCLSHLFNQGMVSARSLRRDNDFRQNFLSKVKDVTANKNILTPLEENFAKFDASKFTVCFCVLVTAPHAAKGTAKKAPKLPFFSLVTFRQAALQIRDELLYQVAFSWVIKPAQGGGKKPTKKVKSVPVP